ncbi:NUDIX hydrolase [Bacillus sp. 2205SS5-2]|uniref:NUDIX hydrolase n=1 Tax=Bacillus sp. 2205SS5-2 TaxID=3109031 RepID=UPI00300712B9
MDTVFKTKQGIFNYRVAGVWIEQDHLLIHRGAKDSFWSLPGGRVKLGEESATSLVREFQEELNVEVKAERLLWSVENFFTLNEMPFHEIGFFYQVSSPHISRLFQKNPFHGCEGEHLIYQWLSFEKLNSITLHPQFLVDELPSLPRSSKHMIIKQTSSS